MPASNRCTQCSSTNDVDAAFCSRCGSPLTGGAGTTVSAGRPAVDVAAILAAANLSRVRKSYPEAVDLCVNLLEVAPTDRAAHSLLGDIYRDMGRHHEAQRWYRMAVDLEPTDGDRRKLAAAERRAGMEATTPTPDSLSRMVAADGSVIGGTAALMGLPPQRWLRIITIAAIAFLATIAVMILVMAPKQRAAAPLPHALDLAPSGPPIIVGSTGTEGVTAPDDNQRAGSRYSAGGSGFAPDSGPPNGEQPSVQPGAGTPVTAGSGAVLQPVALPQGVTITSQRTDSGGHTTNITAEVQGVTPDSINGAQLALAQGAFACARNVLSQDPTLQSAAISLVTPAEPAGNRLLLSGTISRAAAASNFQQMTADALLAQIDNLQWGSGGESP
ncbi:MAG: hypothetical protein KGJ62_06425 [Armatimonadetes bacterium]|nr:hypothetical protein [Armatimonadota bacterium]MDE2206550.1 hypothetical protein [Armatimonadota bacterium]